MHDLVIAEEIVREARKYGEISSITVEVGDLANILPEQLENTLEKLTGWKIKILKKKARVRCSCSFEGNPKITARSHDVVFFECPKCHKIPNILEGNEIIIKEVNLK